MSRNTNTRLISSFQQAQSNQKDILITSLRKQLYELKDLQTQFIRLNQQIANLESKYALLLDQKDRNEKQHRIKMEINKKSILQLRADLDSLKVQVHKANLQIQETVRENTTLKRICDNRNAQISSLLANNQQLQKDNELRIQQNKNISLNIKQLKQQKNKLQAECERLSKLLESSLSLLKQTQKQVRNLEATNAKFDSTLLQAERDNQILLQQLKARQLSNLKTQKNLEELSQKSADLQNKTRLLEQQCAKLQSQYSTININVQNEINKNKELLSKLKTIDSQIRNTENELDQSIVKKQNLKRDHLDLVSDNRALNTEIDKCLINILEYEKLNTELQKQVQNYIESDQQARNLLNRRQLMRNILDQVNIKLVKTKQPIAHILITK